MIKTELIVETALALTGFEDCSNAPYVESLGQFLEVVNSCGNLSQFEQHSMESYMIFMLIRRLSVEHYLAAHPDIGRQDVACPTFIVGLPRSGSSLLHRLLAQDPRRRPLLNWEVDNLVPPARTGELRSDQRCVSRKRIQEITLKHNPELALIHWEFADEPTECNDILALDFKAGFLAALTRIPELLDYSLQADKVSTYEHHKRTLQMLQMSSPGTWNLKSPLHSVNVGTILKVYPDARLIWIHRDPQRVVPSYLSLRASLVQATAGGPADAAANARQAIRELRAILEVLMYASRSPQGDCLYELSYSDLVRDPIGEIQLLYSWLGATWEQETEAALASWLTQNPQHKYGVHRYRVEDHGLSPEFASASFEDYRAAFGEMFAAGV